MEFNCAFISGDIDFGIARSGLFAHVCIRSGSCKYRRVASRRFRRRKALSTFIRMQMELEVCICCHCSFSLRVCSCRCLRPPGFARLPRAQTRPDVLPVPSRPEPPFEDVRTAEPFESEHILIIDVVSQTYLPSSSRGLRASPGFHMQL